MNMRFAWMVAISSLLIGAVMAAFFTGKVGGGSLVEVNLKPREEDGSQMAVAFINELTRLKFESAWGYTAVAMRDEYDYDRFVFHARLALDGCDRVRLETSPRGIVGRISHAGKPDSTFVVQPVLEDGFWRVRHCTFQQ